jgi:hypothetical protein
MLFGKIIAVYSAKLFNIKACDIYLPLSFESFKLYFINFLEKLEQTTKEQSLGQQIQSPGQDHN